MKPVEIKEEDCSEDLRKKVISITEDIYKKFNQINDNVYDFVAENTQMPDIISNADEADLNQTISNPPTQAQVQAISDKMDSLLAKLRNSNIIAP